MPLSITEHGDKESDKVHATKKLVLTLRHGWWWDHSGGKLREIWLSQPLDNDKCILYREGSTEPEILQWFGDEPYQTEKEAVQARYATLREAIKRSRIRLDGDIAELESLGNWLEQLEAEATP
jgi:hypothetical protein